METEIKIHLQAYYYPNDNSFAVIVNGRKILTYGQTSHFQGRITYALRDENGRVEVFSYESDMLAFVDEGLLYDDDGNFWFQWPRLDANHSTTILVPIEYDDDEYLCFDLDVNAQLTIDEYHQWLKMDDHHQVVLKGYYDGLTAVQCANYIKSRMK